MPVPDFSPGEVLTAAAMDSIGLWKVATFTATSGSSLVCSNVFSSTFENYKIVCSGVRTTGDAAISMKMGAAASGHYAGYLRATTASGFNAGYDNNLASWSQVTVSTSSRSGQFSMDIFNPFLSQSTAMVGNSNDPRTTANAPTGYSGWMNDTNSYTSFTLAGGTFTNIKVVVYGYRD
jgi:hypothetical protein